MLTHTYVAIVSHLATMSEIGPGFVWVGDTIQSSSLDFTRYRTFW